MIFLVKYYDIHGNVIGVASFGDWNLIYRRIPAGCVRIDVAIGG